MAATTSLTGRGSSVRHTIRRFARVTCTALLLSVTVCTDFARTNPFDPAVPLTLTIVGPDTIRSALDTVRYVVRADPAVDFPEADWQTSSPMVKIGPGGTYVYPGPPFGFLSP